MKKLEYKLLPCAFCTIGLSCYIVGHNLVHATIQKLTNDSGSFLPNQHTCDYLSSQADNSKSITTIGDM